MFRNVYGMIDYLEIVYSESKMYVSIILLNTFNKTGNAIYCKIICRSVK